MFTMSMNGVPSSSTINTESIFREGELDQGFILRAGTDYVARTLRDLIHK
jgi:hypothetical protein